MGQGRQVCVRNTIQGLHCSAELPSCSSAQHNDCPKGCLWKHGCRHSQSVRWFRGSQARQFLLPEVLSSQTKIRYLWSEAIGHCGNTKTVAATPQRGQLQDLYSAWWQVSRIPPDIQSRVQKTFQVVGNSFSLRLCHLAAPCRPHTGPSRSLDYEIGYEEPVAPLLATVLVEP